MLSDDLCNAQDLILQSVKENEIADFYKPEIVDILIRTQRMIHLLIGAEKLKDRKYNRLMNKEFRKMAKQRKSLR